MKGGKKSKERLTLLEEQKETYKKIGARIKTLRKAKGYKSQEKFANAFEIDRAQLGRFERGADMRISSLVKVVRALDMSFEEFFGEGF